MGQRRTIYIVVAIAAFLLPLYLYLSQGNQSDDSLNYGDLTVQQAFELIKKNPELVILDVRTQQEYDSGYIEKAMLIPIDEFEARVGDLSREVDLLIYCRTGNRSSSAVSILKAVGFTRIYHMKDGITAWQQAGYPVSK